MRDNAIRLGLSENEFWEMTPAEVVRYSDGVLWRKKEQAQFDYVLADLIGASVARVISDKAEYPPIEKVYPSLFEEHIPTEEEQIETVTTNSINNFLSFAIAHNNAKIERS